MWPLLPRHSQQGVLLRLHSALNAARSLRHGLPDAGIVHHLVTVASLIRARTRGTRVRFRTGIGT